MITILMFQVQEPLQSRTELKYHGKIDSTVLISYCSVGEVLEKMSLHVNWETPFRITVHRHCVWTDAIREAKRKAFAPSSLLKVIRNT